MQNIETSPVESRVSDQWLLRSRYPALDGLRGASALLVFLVHFPAQFAGYEWLSFGWVGVDVFFVLSGFLITGGLVDTIGTSNAIKHFYAKRALRIFPLYYAFWLIILICRWPLHWVSFPPHMWTWPLYLGNLTLPRDIANLWTTSVINLVHKWDWQIEIVHFWSLCVEEQFYLVWPLALVLLRNRRVRMAACVLGLAASFLGRWWVWLYGPFTVSHSQWAYRQTFTHCDGLLIGAFIAMLIRDKGIPQSTYKLLIAALLLIPGSLMTWHTLRTWHTVMAAHAVFRSNMESRWSVTTALTVVPLFAAGILLLCLRPDNPVSRMFQFRPLRAIGGISYGFYILHELPEELFQRYFHALNARHLAAPSVIVWFFAAWGLAWLSFRYFESPFLRLKDRLDKDAAAMRL